MGNNPRSRALYSVTGFISSATCPSMSKITLKVLYRKRGCKNPFSEVLKVNIFFKTIT